MMKKMILLSMFIFLFIFASCDILDEISNFFPEETTKNISPNIEKIYLSKQSVSVEIGESFSLKATPYPSNVSYEEFTWETNNESIITVKKVAGNVSEWKAIGVGEAKVYVKSENGCMSICEVFVKNVEIKEIYLNESFKELTVGETVLLNASYYPSNATIINLNWTSTNDQVAKVDGNGLVTAIKEGTAKIEVKSSNGIIATCEIVVKSVDIKPKFDKIVKYVKSNGENLGNGDYALTYERVNDNGHTFYFRIYYFADTELYTDGVVVS